MGGGAGSGLHPGQDMHTTSRSPTITYTSKVTVGNLLRHFSAPTTTRLKIVVSQFESGSRHLTQGLRATAIEDSFISDVMQHSRARSIVLIVDCCMPGHIQQQQIVQPSVIDEALDLALDLLRRDVDEPAQLETAQGRIFEHGGQRVDDRRSQACETRVHVRRSSD